MICTIFPASLAFFWVASFVAMAMFLPLTEGLGPRCDLEHLFGDARLTCFVRGEREVVDEVAGRVRCVAHRDHLRRERGRLRFENGLEDRNFDESRDDLVQDRLRIRLEEVLKRWSGLCPLHLPRRAWKESADRSLLAQRVHEPGNGWIEVV